MSYAIYLDGVRLPVNPEEFTVEKAKNSKEYDILHYGKVSIPESAGLDTYKWESEFPANDYSYCTKWQSPSVFLKLIEDHFNSDQPIELTVSNGTSYGISENVLITSFLRKETEPGGYTYTITCKQYREPVVINENVNVITRPAPAKPTTMVKVNKKTSSVYDAKRKVKNETKKETVVQDKEFKTFMNNPLLPPNEGEVVVRAMSPLARAVRGNEADAKTYGVFGQAAKTVETLVKGAGKVIGSFWNCVESFANRNRT